MKSMVSAIIIVLALGIFTFITKAEAIGPAYREAPPSDCIKVFEWYGEVRQAVSECGNVKIGRKLQRDFDFCWSRAQLKYGPTGAKSWVDYGANMFHNLKDNKGLPEACSTMGNAVMNK